jgi:AraC-like DNA-binding protein
VADDHGGAAAAGDRRALSAVARRCGYASEFAFAKAFKREFAVTPGAFRRAPDLLATDPGVAQGRP